MVKVAEAVLKKVEKDNLDGITSADLLAFFVSQDIKFGEATLRKWVQLGLLPRSVRVGQKGKHQGSKGMYPVRVIRQILRVKELMAQNLTIEDIQQRFLFVRGDIEALEQSLESIFGTLDRMVETRDGNLAAMRAVGVDLVKARALASELLDRLERIEQRFLTEAEQGRSEVAAS